MSNRYLDIKYFDELSGQWGLRKPPSAPSPMSNIPDVRVVSIVCGGAAYFPSADPAARAGAIVEALESAVAHVAVIGAIEDAVYDAVKADPRVRAKYATTDFVAEAGTGPKIGTMLLWQPVIGVQLVESPMARMRGRPTLIMHVRQLCGGPLIFVATWFDEAVGRPERAALLGEGALSKVPENASVIIGCNWPKAPGGAGETTGRVAELPNAFLTYTLGSGESDSAAVLVNACNLRLAHTLPVPRRLATAPLRSVVISSLVPVSTPSTSPLPEPLPAQPSAASANSTSIASAAAAAPPGYAAATAAGARAPPEASPPLAGAKPKPSPKGSPPAPPTATPPTLSPSLALPPPASGKSWPPSPVIPLPASAQAALRSGGAGTSPSLGPAAGTAPQNLAALPPSQPPPSYRAANAVGATSASPAVAPAASPSTPVQAGGPVYVWNEKHAIKLPQKGLEYLMDLDVTPLTASFEDAVRQLNSPPGTSPIAKWPWEYAVAHGRLLGASIASLDIPVVRGWATGRRAAMTTTALPNGRRGMTTSPILTANFGMEGAAANKIAPHTPTQPRGGGRNLWSTLRSAPLLQVSPAELRAFDISRAVGTAANVVQLAVDRLNAPPAGDVLERYAHDYALVFVTERQCYWLIAAANCPCEASACRAAALAFLQGA